MNSASIFRLDGDQAELAAKVLRHGNYRLANLEDKPQLLVILNGLASVAAVTRSHVLADELRVLTRNIQAGFLNTAALIVDAIQICLVSAASRANINDWSQFVGDWLTELAFGDLEGNDGKVFHTQLKCLCIAVPELKLFLGVADAALMAYNASLRCPTVCWGQVGQVGGRTTRVMVDLRKNALPQDDEKGLFCVFWGKKEVIQNKMAKVSPII